MQFDSGIFDSLLEPTFIINETGKVLYANEAGAFATGLSRRRLQRVPSLFDVLHFDQDASSWMTNLAAVTEATPYRELSFSNSSGDKGKAQITIQKLSYYPGDQNWLVFFRDVTLEETLQKKYRAELDQKENVISELKKARRALENYSKNLEKMVENRTSELQSVNRTLSALLDSLGQGFFIFNAEGQCLPVFSKACFDVIECNPAENPVWDILQIDENKVPDFKKWINALFTEMLPFDDIAALAPQRLNHSRGKEIALSYYPIRNEIGKVELTVVMASDITSEVFARREADVERSRAKRILKLVQNPQRTNNFINESKRMVSELDRLTAGHDLLKKKTEIYRSLHTLKGSMATFSFDDVRDLCHKAESALSEVLLVGTDRHEKFMELVRKIQAQFTTTLLSHRELIGSTDKNDGHEVSVDVHDVYNLIERLPGLSPTQVRSEIINHFLLEPIEHYFSHYIEMAEEIASSQSKRLKPLLLSGGHLPVLAKPYLPLFESMVHLFRNSVDHGIETPEERIAAGKSEAGLIEVNFSLQDTENNRYLKITVSDDGAGIDSQKLRYKLEQKGLDTQKLSDDEILQHVFDSELSTRDAITHLSGRGIGMDAVRHESLELGGKAWVETTLGQGTTTHVLVPYLIPFETWNPAKAA